MKFKMISADIKRIVREPILMLLMFVPIFALVMLKLMIIFGVPLLKQYAGFDLEPWYGYVMSTALLIGPCMLGTVAAFMMIDDRDESMIELMAVTPNGYSGYIANRLIMPFFLSIVYSIGGYMFFNIYVVAFWKLIYLAILTGIESIILALFLFSLTDNKVKGLTYAKAMDGFLLTALADLLNIKAVSAVSALIPFYWITSLVVKPDTAMNLVLPLLIHMAWLALALSRVKKEQAG